MGSARFSAQDLREEPYGGRRQRPRGFVYGLLLAVCTADEGLAAGRAQFVRRFAALTGVQDQPNARCPRRGVMPGELDVSDYRRLDVRAVEVVDDLHVTRSFRRS